MDTAYVKLLYRRDRARENPLFRMGDILRDARYARIGAPPGNIEDIADVRAGASTRRGLGWGNCCSPCVLIASTVALGLGGLMGGGGP